MYTCIARAMTFLILDKEPDSQQFERELNLSKDFYPQMRKA